MIQIKLNNLNEVCEKYSDQIFDNFNRSIINFIKIIECLLKDTESVKDNFKGFHLQSLKATYKLISSKIKFENDTTIEKFVEIINKNRITSDKRSKCRKTILLEELRNSLLELNKQVKINELFKANISILKDINSDLEFRFSTKIPSKILSFLFDYERYDDIINNFLAKPLDLKVCPYCNRNYITYIPKDNNINSSKKVVRPTYDHFFNKGKYKYLSLSFYNLIPSCYICNSNLKLTIDFDHEKHINPFIEGFDDDAYFDFELSPDKVSGEINFTPTLKAKKVIDKDKSIRIFGNNTKDDSGNVRVFKLKEIYATHHDTVEEVYMNFDENNRFYVESIKKELTTLGTNEAEFYRFHFKNYFDEKDFNKRPLAKLTKDIYCKMKEINDTI